MFLTQARQQALDWLESVRFRGEGWGRWKYNAAMTRAYGLQCSGMAVNILDELGALDEISPAHQAEAVAFFQRCQDGADGYFKDPFVTEADYTGRHSWEEIYNQWSGVSGALRKLGGAPLYPTPTKRFVDLQRQDAREWFWSLDWSNPWSNSEVVSRALNAYIETLAPGAVQGDWVVQHVLGIYENELLDPATGYPTRGGCDDLSRAMAGVFKILNSYPPAERRFPFAEAAMDTTLALQHPDGEFGWRDNMCINYDAVWVLRELEQHVEEGYRHDEVVEAGNRMAQRLLAEYQQSDGGFAFYRTHCQDVHHSIRLSEKRPIGDMLGTWFCLRCLAFADEWNSGKPSHVNVHLYS